MPDPTPSHMPSSIHSLLEEARSHIDAGRLEPALAIYERVTALAPDRPDLHHTIGLVHYEAGRHDQAVRHIGRSIEIDPSNSAAYRSMGDALAASRQFSMAIKAYEKACALNRANSDALLNLGNLYHELEMFDCAERCYEQIRAHTPDHQQALNNLGRLNHDMGRLGRALSFYDRCIKHHPRHAEAQFNRAALLLAMGDHKRGWNAYEWRFKRPGAENVYPHELATPRWRGDAFQHRRLLVHCEQGMGDVLQFMRYLPLVKQRGGTLIVEVHQPLAPLLQLQPCVDEVVVFSTTRPPTIRHDLHIPMLSLPKVFNTRADTIPQTIPYIEFDRQGSRSWAHHLKEGHLNIGLVWASSATNPKRNLPLEKCVAWFQNPKLHFIALQKGEASGQIALLQQQPSPVSAVGKQLRDFLDTACITARLDLVISVDTAAMHLAGGMGKPLWVPLPFNADWRWPLESRRCAWYPHAEIFRQSKPGDWRGVIAAIAERLKHLLSK